MAFLPKTYENKRVVAISVEVLDAPRLVIYRVWRNRSSPAPLPKGWGRRPGEGVGEGLIYIELLLNHLAQRAGGI